MSNEETAVAQERATAREKLQKAFQLGSPVGAVFIAAHSDADGNTPVLFVNASSPTPEIITYHFGTGGLFGEVAELVADDAGVDINKLDEETFYAIAARSVGAAACSSARVPGVAARSISTRPVMEACKIFAMENRIAKIETVSLARSKKLAYKINKIVNPRPRKVEKPKEETLEDFSGFLSADPEPAHEDLLF